MAYSRDLRERVIGLVARGWSARAAARHFAVGEATGVRWARDWKESERLDPITPRRRDGSKLDPHRDWLLALVAAEPDLTLEDVRTRLAETHGVRAAIVTVWRFFERNGISFKKKPAGRRTGS